MRTPDIEYQKIEMFTAFYPNTKQGETAWNELAKVTDGTGKVLHVQAETVIRNLRRAGYVVRKLKKTDETMESILAELDDL